MSTEWTSRPRRRPGARAGVRLLCGPVLAGVGLAGLVACGPTAPSAPQAATTSDPPAAASAPIPTTSAAPAPSGKCRTDDLVARFVPQADDLGAHRVAVVWTNTSERTCTMTGFGGVDLQGPNDPTFGPTYSLRRSGEDPATVTLEPRAEAQTVVNYLAPDSPGPTWTPTSALVTPPDETRSLPLTWTFGPVLRQDGATRPGTFISPVRSPGGTAGTGTCSPGQVEAAVVDQDAGASNRYARLRLTARPGQSCRLAGPLDVHLRGGGDPPVVRTGGAGLGAVQLDGTHPASSTLHWTVAGDRQATPQALTVALAGGSTEVGWTYGPVDDAPGRGLEVGPLTSDTPR